MESHRGRVDVEVGAHTPALSLNLEDDGRGVSSRRREEDFVDLTLSVVALVVVVVASPPEDSEDLEETGVDAVLVGVEVVVTEDEGVVVGGGGSFRFGGRPRLRLTGTWAAGGGCVAALSFTLGSTFGSSTFSTFTSFRVSSTATGDLSALCLAPPLLFFLFLRIGSSANSTVALAVLERVLGLLERSTVRVLGLLERSAGEELDLTGVGGLSGPESDRVRCRTAPPFCGFFSKASLSSLPPPPPPPPPPSSAQVGTLSPELSSMALVGGGPEGEEVADSDRLIPISII